MKKNNFFYIISKFITLENIIFKLKKLIFENFLIFILFFGIFLWFYFFSDFFNFKKYFFLKLFFKLCGLPRGQSCAVSNCHMTYNMPNQLGCGARDLFQIKIKLQGCNSNFFLQGRKSYLNLIFIIKYLLTYTNLLT